MSSTCMPLTFLSFKMVFGTLFSDKGKQAQEKVQAPIVSTLETRANMYPSLQKAAQGLNNLITLGCVDGSPPRGWPGRPSLCGEHRAPLTKRAGGHAAPGP